MLFGIKMNFYEIFVAKEEISLKFHLLMDVIFEQLEGYRGKASYDQNDQFCGQSHAKCVV